MSLLVKKAAAITKLLLVTVAWACAFQQTLADDSVNEHTPLFPGGDVEYQKAVSDRAHQILLSTPKRISNTLTIEKEQRVAGVRTNTLLKMRPGFSELEAYRYYLGLLSDQGELLYSCEQRGCGSSNHWANNIFNERRLYGRDSDQYYVAGKLALGGVKHWFSVYIVQNGRKDQYIYLSSIPDTDSLDMSDWQRGMHFAKTPLSKGTIEFIRDSLSQGSGLKMFVVGHSAKPSSKVAASESQGMEVANKAADYLKRELEEFAGRIDVRSVGPFGLRPSSVVTDEWFSLYLREP